jgi:hypothetical protein
MRVARSTGARTLADIHSERITMADDQDTRQTAPEEAARREFMRKVGKAALTAPAVALLLTASTRPAAAQYSVRQAEPGQSPRRGGSPRQGPVWPRT